MMAAIVSVLPTPFAAHDPEFKTWWDKAQKWPQRLRDELGLDVEMSVEPEHEEVARKVSLRLKVDSFNREFVQDPERDNAE